MKILFVLMAVVAGISLASQASTNAALAKATGFGPALLINTLVVLAGAISVWVALGAKTTFFPSGTPWTLYIGGVFGFLIVGIGAIVFPRLGAAWAVSLIVLGQSIAALAIDHFALMGMPPIAITLRRIVGVLLVAAGVAVFRL